MFCVYVFVLVVLLLWSLLEKWLMLVANNSPLANDHVVEMRSGPALIAQTQSDDISPFS